MDRVRREQTNGSRSNYDLRESRASCVQREEETIKAAKSASSRSSFSTFTAENTPQWALLCPLQMLIVHTCRWCEAKFTRPPWSAEHVYRITWEMHLSAGICLLFSRNLLALYISRFISLFAEVVRGGIVQLGFSYGWINTSWIFTVMIFSVGSRMQLILFINASLARGDYIRCFTKNIYA